MKRLNRAFTLIELITVIVISSILLGIIAIPLVQGFELTRAAQALANAQDRARTLVRTLETEVGNGAGVRDNTGERGATRVVVPGQDGNPEPVTLNYTKLDILKPAEGDPTRGPSGAFVNPDTGKEDPTLQAPKGQVNLPASPGLTIVRYFVGLRDPGSRYNNPYDGLLMQRNGQRDNLYVLYRAEVQPYVFVDTDNNPGTPPARVVNAEIFFDQGFDNDPNTNGPLLDDPDFFRLDVPIRTYTQIPPGWRQPGQPDKATMVQNWLKRAAVVTEVSRYDMIAPVYDRNSRAVSYDGNAPRLVSLVRFQPTRVTSEPALGKVAVRTGEESVNTAKVGPDVFATQFGSWSNIMMRVWPSLYPTNWGAGPGQDDAGDVRRTWGSGLALNTNQPYLVARNWYDPNDPNRTERTSLFGFDPAVMGNDLFEGTEIFDVKRFFEVRAMDESTLPRPYAFTEGVNAANARSNWLSFGVWRENFVPVVPDPKSGRVMASFDSREVGTDPSVPYEYRVPTFGQESAPANQRFGVRVSTYDANTSLDYNPGNDPDVGAGVWSDQVFNPVNKRFNKLWADFTALAPNLDRATYVKRYIDLRVCTQPDGTQGGLDPRNAVGRAYITPGSEVIVGPDQRPGPNFGRYVRYTRTTQRPVGQNQYFINYVDIPEPDWQSLGFGFGGIVGNPYDPLTYTANNFLQAVLQAQLRAGYVELNSNYGEPIPSGYTLNGNFVPTGNIYAQYRFQYTEPNDVVAVDYDSAQVMEMVVTIRNYAQTSAPNAQAVTVRGSAEVRNFLR